MVAIGSDASVRLSRPDILITVMPASRFAKNDEIRTA